MPHEYYYASRSAEVFANKEIAEIGKTGMIHAAAAAEPKRAEHTGRGRAIERGQYVPDDAHIDICLNCTRKKCTGYCKRVKGARRKRG